jgi:polysaccharide export outer membrane protein
MNRSLLLAIPLLGIAVVAPAQERVQPVSSTEDAKPDTHKVPNTDSSRQLPPQIPFTGTADADYTLGADDQISLTVVELDDQFTDKVFRIEMSGDVNIPLVGRVRAAGLTVKQLEESIEKALDKILREPQVVVGIVQFGSQPVSVLGEVNTPGVHQVKGQKNLLQALSLAGGFTESVGNTVTITRNLQWGVIPLPNAHDDPTGQYSVASISVKEILHGANPAKNISVMADDVITVSRAEIVYAVGSVNKPGGFLLGQDEGLSTLQVLSLAEGLTKTAAPQKAMILRLSEGSKHRTEIAVNLKTLMQGNGNDLPLQPGDILFVPNSAGKTATYRTIDAVLQGAAFARY